MSATICALPGNEAFAARLRDALGAENLPLEWRRFPDGESYLRFVESCRGKDIGFICTLNNPDPKIMALHFAARTARELGARSVGLVAPYLAYMRQDRRFQEGEAVTSIHFAALLSSSFDWLATVDPHLHRYGSLSEVYTIPAQAVSAAPALADWIKENVAQPLIIGPDSESEQWAAGVAAVCGAPHAVMSKTRLGDRSVRVEAPSLLQWKDRTPVLLDDIVSSAHTMALAAVRVTEQGLREPLCVAVHGVFAEGALAALREAGVTRIVTCNTVPHESNAIDVAELMARAVADLRKD